MLSVVSRRVRAVKIKSLEGQILDTEALLGSGLTHRSDLDIILSVRGGKGLEVGLRGPSNHPGLGEAGLGRGGEGGELCLGPGCGQWDTWVR